MAVVKIDVIDRGPTPRGMKKVIGNAMKETWQEAAIEFHARFSDDRFTNRHATAAGYAPRSKNYTRRKLKEFGHTRPMEFSGTARRLSRTANVTSTSKTATLRYPGLRVFNFKHPKQRADLREEFTKVLPEEAQHTARFYDVKLGQKLNSYSGTN